MRFIIFCLIFCSFWVSAQNYSILKVSTKVNMTPGAMNGVPGDFFAATITFSNSSSSPIFLVVDRYKNDIPPYWAVCYCYIQCHSPRKDSIMVEIQPLSSTDITLQFKTDSVNPGIAREGFNIYQVGFESNVQDLQMTASTLIDVGVIENQSNQLISINPNPSADVINIDLPFENVLVIKVQNISGSIMEAYTMVNSGNFSLNILNYTKGIYFIQVETKKNTYVKRFIKN